MIAEAIFFDYLLARRGVAQSGSASGLGPEGRKFESCLPDQFLPFRQFLTV